MSMPGSQPAKLTGGSLVLATLILGMANFVVLLDTTIANVSVPHIAGGLAVSPSQGTWVITSYSVAEAIVVPLTGWLAQRFGALKVFLVGMVGFGIFSVACGLAPSFAMLVTFRVLQGICGGPIMPMSQTLLLSVFPREKTQQAMGFWSMTTVVAPILGPILGGNISDTIGWSWIFFINIPIAALVVFGAWSVMRNHDTVGRRVPVDYIGLAMLVVWVGSLQIMLDKGKELEWFSSPTIIALAIVAAVVFCAFLIWELTAEHPIVNLRIFRHRGFVAGVITISLTFGAFFGSVVLVPLWLQTSMGYTATAAGYTGAMNGILAVIMSPIVARYIGKIDPRMLVTFGVGWMSLIAFWRSNFTTEADFWFIALTFLVQGFCMPFFFVAATSIVLSSVNPEETPSAAGLSNFLRTTSAAFATSIITTAWDNSAQAKRSDLVAHMSDPSIVIGNLANAGLNTGQATGTIDRLLQQQAVMLATNRIFIVTVAIFAIAAASIWIAPRPTRAPGMGGDH
jgi:MFS transporter, DHA2 family, multidrug resistance protein